MWVFPNLLLIAADENPARHARLSRIGSPERPFERILDVPVLEEDLVVSPPFADVAGDGRENEFERLLVLAREKDVGTADIEGVFAFLRGFHESTRFGKGLKYFE